MHKEKENIVPLHFFSSHGQTAEATYKSKKRTLPAPHSLSLVFFFLFFMETRWNLSGEILKEIHPSAVFGQELGPQVMWQ